MLALLKLQNGTEVIGNVREEEETKVVLEDPLQINYRLISTQPMPTVSVSRYMPFASEKIITFEKKNLLHVVKPKQAMIEYYNHALNNYKVVIDKNIEEELIGATRSRQEYNEYEEDISESYKALLERLNFKGPLN
jgi:hypothetical protein